MDDRNNQLIILGNVCKFALKCKKWALKNLCKIGPRLEVGERQSQGKFFQVGGRRTDGWTDGGGRRRMKGNIKTSF